MSILLNSSRPFFGNKDRSDSDVALMQHQKDGHFNRSDSYNTVSHVTPAWLIDMSHDCEPSELRHFYSFKRQHLALVSLAVACHDVVVVAKETSDRFETDWSNTCDHAAATGDGHHTKSNAGESPPRHSNVSRHSSSKQVPLRASFEKPHAGRVYIKQRSSDLSILFQSNQCSYYIELFYLRKSLSTYTLFTLE